MAKLSEGQVDRYQPQLQRAIRYVVDHVERPVRTGELAKAAGLSEYHFHRIFRAVMGETIGQFVTRYRLESAARMIAYEPNRSITEIGFACGYSSTANFSKAFSSFFGFTPSAVRSPEKDQAVKLGVLERRYNKTLLPEDFFPQMAPADRVSRLVALRQRVRFAERERTALACISGPGGYDVPQGLELWQRLVTQLSGLGLWRDGLELFGAVHDDPVVTAEALCRYHACVALDVEQEKLPVPLFCAELPEGRYAVFLHQGSVKELDELYRDIYSLWFPSSGLTPGQSPPFERYLGRGPDARGQVSLELLFQVENARSS